MAEEVGQFRAVADDGEKFTVIIYREVVIDRALDGSSTRRLGLPRLETDTSQAVTPSVNPKTFKIVQTDQIIRKAD